MGLGIAVCAKCNRQMKPKRIGVPVLETFENGAPYKLWLGDLAECHGCGSEVVVGFASHPIAEHFQDTFAAKMKSYAPTISFGCPSTDYKRAI